MEVKQYGYRIYFKINGRVEFIEINSDDKSIYGDENILPQMLDYLKENDLEFLYLDDINNDLICMEHWKIKK